MSECPKCGAERIQEASSRIENMVTFIDAEVFACKSHVHFIDGFRQSNRCRIAELEAENAKLSQQLARYETIERQRQEQRDALNAAVPCGHPAEYKAADNGQYICWECEWMEAEQQLAEAQAEATQLRSDLAVLAKRCEGMKDGLNAVADLINESYGVAGLHQNGDVASWEELRTGGNHEDWLVEFDEALSDPAADEIIARVRQ